VLRVRVRGIRQAASLADQVVFEVGAGELFDAFVESSVRANYGGLECLSGIPGLVGATPIQNVGAYGQEIGERILTVRVLDRAGGEVRTFDRAECLFSYRSSVFKEEKKDRLVVLAVAVALTPGEAAPIRYFELADQLAARGKDPRSLADVRET